MEIVKHLEAMWLVITVWIPICTSIGGVLGAMYLALCTIKAVIRFTQLFHTYETQESLLEKAKQHLEIGEPQKSKYEFVQHDGDPLQVVDYQKPKRGTSYDG